MSTTGAGLGGAPTADFPNTGNGSIATSSKGETMPVTPYLFFNGRCEEALSFYKKALGAEVGMMMRFKEAPEPPPPT